MTVPPIATDDALDALVLEAAPGEIVEDAALTLKERHAAYQMAGAFAAAVHALPCEDCGTAERYADKLLASAERYLGDPAASQTTSDAGRVRSCRRVRPSRRLRWFRRTWTTHLGTGCCIATTACSGCT
jgi:aminoglycoside phosphotransferase